MNLITASLRAPGVSGSFAFIILLNPHSPECSVHILHFRDPGNKVVNFLGNPARDRPRHTHICLASKPVLFFPTPEWQNLCSVALFGKASSQEGKQAPQLEGAPGSADSSRLQRFSAVCDSRCVGCHRGSSKCLCICVRLTHCQCQKGFSIHLPGVSNLWASLGPTGRRAALGHTLNILRHIITNTHKKIS